MASDPDPEGTIHELELILDLLERNRLEVPARFIPLLKECIRESLARRPVNRVKNALARREARLEDQERLYAVLNYAGEFRSNAGIERLTRRPDRVIPITKAFELVARDRARATGVHVTHQAIRASCRRAAARLHEAREAWRKHCEREAERTRRLESGDDVCAEAPSTK